MRKQKLASNYAGRRNSPARTRSRNCSGVLVGGAGAGACFGRRIGDTDMKLVATVGILARHDVSPAGTRRIPFWEQPAPSLAG
jgi:hypothetical protein